MPKKAKKEDKKNSGQEISWRAAEYQYVQKDIIWYFIVCLVALLLIVIALFSGNFFFAVFVIIAAVTVIFFAKRRPQVFDFKIADQGVAIGENIFYDYERLDGFAIRERPEKLDEIVLRKKAALNPYVRIPIDSTLAEEAKNMLGEKIPEIEYQESFVEVISEWFGF